ncbi:MAG: hypothetical protein ACHQF2_05710 [Flavobacteriales bacterium]
MLIIMQDLEPYYGWNDLYRAENDRNSPFFGREYSEFEFTNQIYNYVIHPQWDSFGSPTLLLKVLYVNYNKGYAVIELLGEWNDCINNDIMLLKRDLADLMIAKGICRFILVGENVLNFHASDECYYEEWFDDVYEHNGWIALVNFRSHVLNEMVSAGLDQYMVAGGELNMLDWRTYRPSQLLKKIEGLFQRRLTG